MILYRSATLRRLFGTRQLVGDVEVGSFSPSPEVFNVRRVTFVTLGFYFGDDVGC